VDDLGPINLDDLPVLLMAYEDERERRDILDPNDLDEDPEWDEEDWDDLPGDRGQDKCPILT
jgi:hypothetical protein